MNDSPLVPYIPLIAAFLAAGCVLYLLKTALACVRKPRLQSLIEEGQKKYAPVLAAAEKPGVYLASLSIGIVFLEVAAGCLGGLGLSGPLAKALAPLGLSPAPARALAVFLISVCVMALFFILGDVALRQIALAFPEDLSVALFPLVRLVPVLAFPLLMASRGISAFMKKLLAAGAARRGMTEEELRYALLEGEKSGVVESEERSMVEGVFYLGDRPVSAFMTHRSEIEWLDIEAGPDEARRVAENAGRQFHIPVTRGDLDEVTGSVSAQDIFRTLLDKPWPGLGSIMRAPYYIPETMSALKAFEAFKKADALYLFAMDEYGGFSGMLTMRNLIEEIVGELSASPGREETIVKQEDGTWLADGGASVDGVARELELSGLGGDHSEYHTLAGFVLDLAGEIPREGASFDCKGYRFKIIDMDNNRIDKILISKIGGVPEDE